MISAERELRKFLRSIRRNIIGLSRREKSSCLREIERNIRDEVWHLRGSARQTRLLKAVESMGNPIDIAREYSVTIYEAPTKRTYALLGVCMSLLVMLVLLGFIATFLRQGEDYISPFPIPVDILGLIVISLGIPALVLLILQIVIPRLMPTLRMYVLLPYFGAIVFGSLIVFLSVWFYVPNSIFNPTWYYDSLPRIIGLSILVGYASLFLLATVFLTWMFFDTRKYELILSGRKAFKGDYVRAVMRKLTSLDIATRSAVKRELEMDIEERLKGVSDDELEEDSLFSELGNPNEMALMLLESHRPAPESRIKKWATVPLAVVICVSFAVGLVFSFTVVQLMTDRHFTFQLSALIMGFPLLIVSIALWIFLAKMVTHPLKKKDFLKPTVALTIVAVLAVSPGLVAVSSGQFFVDDVGYVGSTFAGAHFHDDGDRSIFWIYENQGSLIQDSSLHMTEVDLNGRPVSERKVLNLPGNDWYRHQSGPFLTDDGNYIVILDTYRNTNIIKVSRDGYSLGFVQEPFQVVESRFSEDRLHLAWSHTEYHPGGWHALLGFSTYDVEPNLRLMGTWTETFGESSSFNDPRYDPKDIIIADDRVMAVVGEYSRNENFSSISLTFHSFDYSGNPIDEIQLYLDNVTKQPFFDRGNYTGAVVNSIKQLDSGKIFVLLQTKRVISGNMNMTLEALVVDSSVSEVDITVLSRLEKYDPCEAGYYPSTVTSSYRTASRVALVDDRLHVLHWERNFDRPYDGTYCSFPYEYNATKSGVFLAVFSREGEFVSTRMIAGSEFEHQSLTRFHVLASNEETTLFWGGDINGETGCSGYECLSFSFHQTRLDKNGTIVSNLTYEGDEPAEFFTFISFRPLRVSGDRLIGVGQNYEGYRIISPKIQFGCDPCASYMAYLYFGDIDLSSGTVEKNPISPWVPIKDEVLEVLLSILFPVLAIVTLQISYLIWRMRESGVTKHNGKNFLKKVSEIFSR
jgi:hypothetical protein